MGSPTAVKGALTQAKGQVSRDVRQHTLPNTGVPPLFYNEIAIPNEGELYMCSLLSHLAIIRGTVLMTFHIFVVALRKCWSVQQVALVFVIAHTVGPRSFT